MRDAAYIGETLIATGYEDVVAGFIPSLFEHQAQSGYLPAIIEPTGPRRDVEWDAQGQLMFLIGEWYRYTGDTTQLAQWYPHVRQSAEFIRSLREITANNPPETRGILPPSKSAEDLGSPDWHHYWDNFWAVAGLENGAEIALALGETNDAFWMYAEAHDLRLAMRASIEAVMGDTPAYIPNAPKTPPVRQWRVARPMYFIPSPFSPPTTRWWCGRLMNIMPVLLNHKGVGYKHIFEKWWVYGGLGLARDYVRLGRHDILHQILGWSLNNQTLPNTYAWAEQVDPNTQRFFGGGHAPCVGGVVLTLRLFGKCWCYATGIRWKFWRVFRGRGLYGGANWCRWKMPRQPHLAIYRSSTDSNLDY